MQKSEYSKPLIEVVVVKGDLLDTLPKDSSTHDDDVILAKPNDMWFDEEDDDTQYDLWDE